MLTLEEIINNFMSQHELPDGSFRRCQDLAIRGYRQLSLHSIGEPCNESLTILGNKTAEMPCNLLTVLEIGPLNSKGEIVGLTRDDSLSLGDSLNSQRTDQTIAPVSFTEQDYLFSNPINNINYPGFFSQQYGIGSHSDLGFYKLDYKSRTIVFDFQMQRTDLHISYLPMSDSDGFYYVNPLFQEALIGWLEWQHMRGNKKYNGNDIQEAKNYYDNQLRIARRSQNPFNPSDVYNAYAQTTRMARF